MADALLPLTLDDVSFVARGRTILDRVSLRLDAGNRTIVLGANGAGKSVLLRVMHGLLAPTSGSVRWASDEIPGAPRRQAMVFQRPVLFRRSAIGNLRFALAVAGVPAVEREGRATAALERVGLSAIARQPARVLSGGEQQRLALARAWMLAPDVLFLDEPTANLDPGATREIERVILAIHGAGTKIVMVTHNLGQAQRLADEILFLHHGRLAERSAASVFFRRPATAEAAAYLDGELPWRPTAAA
jgi:tungstate transport system ATP-binding protein